MKKGSLDRSRRIRTRIAPSPTGFVHVGTAYASLFNYAFAKKHGGDFILRIEDTDIKRGVPKAEKVILQGLAWLGIKWDEGPYRQSERLEIYQKYIQKLIKEKKAYQDEGAVRFKFQGKSAVAWQDLVRGEIRFPAEQIQDFVILKSDGYPTYNFAVVVDDSLMKISHVIRAEEHISNTPKQIVLYQALGFELPKFAHFPLLRNPDRSKISKRKNPVALSWYQEQGYFPQALLNFLCLLGWSHPENKEIFSLSEFIEVFNLKRVRKAGPIFNLEKLDWMNGVYIRKTSIRQLADQIWNFFKRKYPQKMIEQIIPLIKNRIRKLSEFESLAGFFFVKPKVDKKLLGKNYQNHLRTAILSLENVQPWDIQAINKSLLRLIKDNHFQTAGFFMDLRIAVTGKKVTPPINESIVILGKEEALKRLKQAL